uniref:Ceramide synthase 5 n=1 Tax=Astyanax mexicanus TaxID=7994 RepID=A0A8B9KEH1_ASTMX
MAALVDWFWDERFWLPHNVTWADLADPAPGVEYPKAGHLLRALPLALGIFVVRIFFESPGAKYHRTPSEVFLICLLKSPDSRKLDGLSKQLDWDSPWMWDTRQCWYNYPYQVLTPGLYHYYVTELAFYWSLMFSQFTDIKRKDFLIMFVHHLATVSLISFSYANNMVRVGSLVLCVHDTSDFLLEAAKLANYAKYQRLCDFLFVVFGAAFFGTRLIIYPFWWVTVKRGGESSSCTQSSSTDVILGLKLYYYKQNTVKISFVLEIIYCRLFYLLLCLEKQNYCQTVKTIIIITITFTFKCNVFSRCPYPEILTIKF